jgi:hypothetical protein
MALIGGGAPEPLPKTAADVRVRLAGLRRRRVPASADRPHRLVRDHEPADLIGREAVEADLDLPIEDVERIVRVTLSSVSRRSA